MPARLFDRSSGKWVDVRDEDVDGLVANGSHAFQQGLTIPVVGKDGDLYDLPAENAEKAFRDGAFRWTTPQDTRAFEDRKNDEILDEHAGGAGQAFVSGVVRGGTLGLSDAIVPKLAGALGGDESFATEALNRQRENSPTAALVGEIGGSLIGAPEAAIKGLKEVGVIAKEATAATRAGRIAQTAAQQASEGLVYGLGQGVSEAALGDPDEVVQNLAASTAMGGLFGGAFGGAFGATKELAPGAKALVTKGYQKLEDTFENYTRKAVAKAGKAVTADAEAAGAFEKAVYDKEFREMVGNGGEAEYDKLMEDVTTGRRILEKESKKINKALNAHLTDEPKRIRQIIAEEILPQADGNIQAGVDELANQIAAKNATIDAELVDARITSSKNLPSFMENMQGLGKRLRDTGDSKAIRLANQIDSTIEAEMSSRQMVDIEEFKFLSAADERRLNLDLRDMVENAAQGKSKRAVDKLLKPAVEELTKDIHANPFFGEAQKEVDEYSGAYNRLRSFLTGTGLNKTAQKDVKQSILNSLLIDTRKAKQYDEVMRNIAEFAPEMEAFRKAGKDAIAQQGAVEALSSKLNTLRADKRAIGEKLSSDDLHTFLVSLDAGPHLLDNVHRLREVQEALQAGGNTPATNYLAVLKTMGHPISEYQEKLLSKGELFENLEKHFAKRHEPATVEKLLRLAVKRPIRAVAGATIGGYFGDTTGAILGTAAAAATNPYFVLKNLTRLEKAAQQAATRATKATESAIDALTGKGAKKLNSAYSGNLPSLKDRRKNFKERANFTTSMATDPEALVAEFENRFGDMEQSPAISGAMMKQFTATAQFLDSKLPKDPLAGQYLSGFHSKWQPNDSQLAIYERYVKAVEDPVSVVEDLSRGRVSPEAVEALKTLNPKMFEQLQTGVTDAIMKPDANLSYKQKLLIGTLFEIPADPSMTANFIASMQENYADAAPQDASQAQSGMVPRKTTARPLTMNTQAIATETSRITNT